MKKILTLLFVTLSIPVYAAFEGITTDIGTKYYRLYSNGTIDKDEYFDLYIIDDNNGRSRFFDIEQATKKMKPYSGNFIIKNVKYEYNSYAFVLQQLRGGKYAHMEFNIVKTYMGSEIRARFSWYGTGIWYYFVKAKFPYFMNNF